MIGSATISGERQRELRHFVAEYVIARGKVAILRHRMAGDPSSEAQAKLRQAEEQVGMLVSRQERLSPDEQAFTRQCLDNLPSELIDPLSSDAQAFCSETNTDRPA